MSHVCVSGPDVVMQGTLNVQIDQSNSLKSWTYLLAAGYQRLSRNPRPIRVSIDWVLLN